jgi:synaptic vesicle membrane protein VAT-1
MLNKVVLPDPFGPIIPIMLSKPIEVNYLTVWQLLAVIGWLKREAAVLIHHVGGGVGMAAINIARHIGATIYGTKAVAGPSKYLPR